MTSLETKIRNGRSFGGDLVWKDCMEDADGTRIARDFFFKVLAGLCNQSFRHWQWEGDYYPLTKGERHWYSHFAASVDRLNSYHLSEHSIKRKSRAKEPNAGRVDLWANYRETNFLIELKRVTFGYNSTKWPARIEKATNAGFRQASSLKHESKNEWENGCVRAGLCLALPYSTSKRKPIVDASSHGVEAARFMKQGIAKMKPAGGSTRPNVVATWTPPTKACVFEYDGGWEQIPFVGFLGRIASLD